mmetsp:Transcript_46936/g.117017  ORF Transcript_46936/g.117017 Transcript_46936/m.117017 type:complete len:216 (+) Transcript_46936:715-1362(+)
MVVVLLVIVGSVVLQHRRSAVRLALVVVPLAGPPVGGRGRRILLCGRRRARCGCGCRLLLVVLLCVRGAVLLGGVVLCGELRCLSVRLVVVVFLFPGSGGRGLGDGRGDVPLGLGGRQGGQQLGHRTTALLLLLLLADRERHTRVVLNPVVPLRFRPEFVEFLAGLGVPRRVLGRVRSHEHPLRHTVRRLVRLVHLEFAVGESPRHGCRRLGSHE